MATFDEVYVLNLAMKHKFLLSERAWSEILTASPLNHMGFGCTITNWHGKKRITHNGGSAGFRTLHVHLPEDDFDVILLSNYGYGEARASISEYIHECFYEGSEGASESFEMDKGYI